MTKYGIEVRREETYGGVTYTFPGAAAMSEQVTFLRNPESSEKRTKPPASQLIWQMTNYSHYTYRTRYWPFVQKGDAGYYQWKNFGSSVNWVSFDWSRVPPEPPDPMNQLLVKIRDDVANVANMLGEYKQTAKMVEDGLFHFARAVTLMRRRRYGKAMKELKSFGEKLRRSGRSVSNIVAPPSRSGPRGRAANAWLQFHFGVEPLAKDIYKLCEEIRNSKPKPLVTKKVTKVARTSIPGSYFVYEDSAKRTQLQVWGTYTRKLTAYVEVDNALLQSASDHGLTSPASLVWELTAFSFVVDWFIGVGEWLQALDVPLGISRSICYETRKLQFSHSYNMSGLTVNFEESPKASLSHRLTSREVRPLTAVMPRWKASVTTTRTVTALALLQQLKRKP